jgi:hypothetical protein
MIENMAKPKEEKDEKKVYVVYAFDGAKFSRLFDFYSGSGKRDEARSQGSHREA